MGESEINMILGALQEARDAHERQLGYVYSEIKAMRHELTSNKEHLIVLDELKELENRTKALELKQALTKGEIRGIVMTVSFIGTVIGAVIAFVIDWLKK
jgi:uncharacterized coiled-coil protein SlyX